MEGLAAASFHASRPGPGVAIALRKRPPFSPRHLLLLYGSILLALGMLLVLTLFFDQGPFARPLEISPAPFDFSREPVANIVDLKARHAAQPDDLVTYQALVQSLVLHHQPLPDDFDSYWHAHDPENGFWPALKAAVLSWKVKGTPDPEIPDPGTGSEALAEEALAEASRLPLWIDRRREMEEQTRSCFRQPETLRESLRIEKKLRDADPGPPPTVDDFVLRKAGELSTRKEQHHLEDLLSTWEKTVRLRLIQPGLDHPPAPVETRFSTWNLNNLLKDEPYPGELRLRIGKLLHAQWPKRITIAAGPGFERMPETALGLSYEPTKDSFRERRMAEYAAADRRAALWMAEGTIALLAVLMAIGLKKGNDRIVAAAASLFTFRDTLRTILFGVVIPFLWWVALVEFTPAGGHGFGIRIWEDYLELRFNHLLWNLSIVTLVLLVILTLRAAVQNEMARRAAFLPPPSSLARRRAGWLMVAAIAIAAAVPGFIPAGSYRYAPMAAAGLALWLALFAGWLLWSTGTTAAVLRRAFLGPLVASQRCIIPLSLLTLLLLAAVPCLRKAESHWLKNDSLNPLTPAEMHPQQQQEQNRINYTRAQLR